ncbi:MAG: UDP-2,3-diacylglucosamine diphosphatase [Methylohalobius sp. ZOD2]|nr:UDP-2,3-diacylglucosamine diphosphatase [Methylothermaceae bacterium]
MKLHCRTVCLSDIHLGTRNCKAEELVDFLRRLRCDTLYLVGDVIDFWRLKQAGWYWPAAHNEVVRQLLTLAQNGTRVVYIPGNHDELLRGYVGTEFNGIEIASRCVHENADGRRLMILHGDEFDAVICSSPWLSAFGSRSYDALLGLNHWVNLGRRKLGLPYWSFASFLKSRVKNAVDYIATFEQALIHSAHRQQVDGIFCGHIHHPALRQAGGILYGNCGDWVEHCTALMEDATGQWSQLFWMEDRARLLTDIRQASALPTTRQRRAA